jgi:flagella basal body P-ring formation protein FlgA
VFLSRFLCALACAAATQAVAADAVVALRADAVLAGPVVRLGDIAQVSAEGSEARDSLAAVEIGVVPRPGHTGHLSQPQVERMIEAHAPAWRGRFRMAGSKAVTLRGAGVAVDQQRLAQLAADALRAELAPRYAKLEIAQVGEPRALTLPPAAQLRARAVSAPLARRMPVWIDIEVEGRAFGAVPVWFAVSAWQAVAVASADLAEGTLLRAGDLALEMREVAESGKVLDRLPAENGFRLRHALARGTPLAQGALEAVTAVGRNQPVTVRIATGNIAIESTAIALADGRVGDTVKVKNANSSEPFLATVVAPAVVSINPR